MRSIDYAILLSALAAAAPAALAEGALVSNEGRASWFLKQIKEFRLTLESADEPELAVKWLQRSAAEGGTEEKEPSAEKAGTSSGLEVRKGESLVLDFGKAGFGDEIWVTVADLSGNTKLSIQLTRVRGDAAGEYRTEVKFHAARGESDLVAKAARWEGNALTLVGDFWPSSLY